MYKCKDFKKLLLPHMNYESKNNKTWKRVMKQAILWIVYMPWCKQE